MNDDYRKGYLEAYKTFVVNHRATMQSDLRYVSAEEAKTTTPLSINGVTIDDLFNLNQFPGDNS